MKINYNVTGNARKELARIIGQAVGIEPVYMRMPTCAYAVGNIILNRSGEMIWDERTDEAIIQKVIAAISAAGFRAESEDSTTEDAEQAQTEDQTGSETTEPEPVELTVSLPTTRHTGTSLRNLVNLFYTRAGLINKALGTGFVVEQGLVNALAENENLRTAEDFTKALTDFEGENGTALSGIVITPQELSFTSLPETTDTAKVKAFTELMAMMNKQAIDQKRILAKPVNEENEKYALRIWLTRLGMNGPEFKETRKILMENLNGHCAFRTKAEEEKWKARQAEKREALKVAKDAAATIEEVSEQ